MLLARVGEGLVSHSPSGATPGQQLPSLSPRNCLWGSEGWDAPSHASLQSRCDLQQQAQVLGAQCADTWHLLVAVCR